MFYNLINSFLVFNLNKSINITLFYFTVDTEFMLETIYRYLTGGWGYLGAAPR
jgi:hypothetical protein